MLSCCTLLDSLTVVVPYDERGAFGNAVLHRVSKCCQTNSYCCFLLAQSLLVGLRSSHGATKRILMCMRGADLAHTTCNVKGLACRCIFAISTKDVGEPMVIAAGASAVLMISSVRNCGMGGNPSQQTHQQTCRNIQVRAEASLLHLPQQPTKTYRAPSK